MTNFRTLTVAVIVAALPSIACADATTTDSNIVRPLREITRVKATSSFCKAFVEGAAPAARSALAYENRLALTLSDLAHYDGTDELAKSHGVALLTDDLRALADSSLAGRGELAALRASAIASGTQSDTAVVAFADALDGAKGRQMELARHVARIVGTIAEQDVYTIVNTSTDRRFREDTIGSNPFGGRFADTGSALLDGSATTPALEGVFFTAPGDDLIGRDLARAIDNARVAETLENCT